MRVLAVLFLTLTAAASFEFSAGQLHAAEAFEGLWAQTKEECLDEEGPSSKTLIDLANVIRSKPTPIFDQYENHCRIERKSVLGNSTTLAVTCFEFWEEFMGGSGGRETIIQLSPGQEGSLLIDGQKYERCEATLVTE